MESFYSIFIDSVLDILYDKEMNGGVSFKDKLLERKYNVDR